MFCRRRVFRKRADGFVSYFLKPFPIPSAFPALIASSALIAEGVLLFLPVFPAPDGIQFHAVVFGKFPDQKEDRQYKKDAADHEAYHPEIDLDQVDRFLGGMFRGPGGVFRVCRIAVRLSEIKFLNVAVGQPETGGAYRLARIGVA